jgi:O-antigen ligase
MDVVVPTPHPLVPRLRWTAFAFLALAFFAVQFTPDTVDPYLRALYADERPEAATLSTEAMTGSTATGSLQRQLVFVALGAFGALGLARRRGAALRPLQPLAALIILYVAMMAASVLWAELPPLSFRRLAAFLLTFSAIGGVLRQLDGEDVVDLTFFTTAGYLGAGLALEVANGAFHPFAGGYRFFGLFHPNMTAQACALLVLSVLASPRERRHRWAYVAAAAAAVLLLVLTRSRAANAALFVTFTARFVVSARPTRTAVALLAGAWIGCFGLLVGGDRAIPALERAVLLGRVDPDTQTLSGRTTLWDELLEHVAERPLLGHGLGSFWTAEHVEEISRSQRWAVSHGHSIYVDQLLDFGAVGLALFVPMVGVALVRSLRRFRASGDEVHGFVFSLLVFTLAEGFLESVVATPAFLSFLVYWSLAFLAFRETSPS